ncbi:MAG: right-handed parallel beta-helix repeat-containing protein [Abyssibacter sp.]|uniref:right-handed parallel beta-helix repeat-containing protein n=1 Tax=Abyssibacter sp. TaxID=2320200 RepID=UPI0032192835
MNHGMERRVTTPMRRAGTLWRSWVGLLAVGLAGCGAAGESGEEADPVTGATGDAFVHALRVNSELDQVDADPGDLICASAEGHCTLRAAIMEASASGFNAAGERHTILLPPGVFTLSLPNALSTGDVGLGDVLARPIVASEATGSLNIMVPMSIHGAGARQTTIDGQRLDRVFELSRGADSRLTDLGITGGFGNTMGGGIYAQAHLVLERVHIFDNWSSGGGGIFVNPLGSLTLNDSTVSHNTAKGQAGGIRIDTRGTITNSTISHNKALGLADPVLMGTGVPFTFAQGGGVDIRGIGTVIRNSTIAFNEAHDGGAGLHFDTAYVDALPDPVTGALAVPHFDVILENTIIAHNLAEVAQGDCLATVGLSRILSQGHNLDSDGSCGLDQAGDLIALAPMLGELANHGGPTDTLALMPASPARGAGNPATCTLRDQRGVARDADSVCDIGAFEATE